MKTYKQKAEEYVRGKCPELMKLSFGCELLHMGEHKGTYITKEDILWDNGEISDMYYGAEEDVIIGHPIQLAHVLRLLVEDWRGEFLEVWDLEKDWNNQEERVFKWLCNEWKV